MHNQKKDNNQFKNKTKQKTQNCQKIKLYGSLTTKELNKHSSRLVGGAQTGSWADMTGKKHSNVADHTGKAGAG